MAERGVSRPEFIRRRRGSDFVGRREEVGVFQAILERVAGADGFEFLFHVHGIAGAGKTSLVRQWDTKARDHYGAVTALVDDDVHSAVEAMAAVSEQLGQQGCGLKGFDKLLATYHQRRHEAETAAVGASAAETDGAPASASVSVSVSSTVATQMGLVGLSMVPGLSLFHLHSELVRWRVRTAWTRLVIRVVEHRSLRRNLQDLRVAMACSTRAQIFAWDRFTAFWPGGRPPAPARDADRAAGTQVAFGLCRPST